MRYAHAPIAILFFLTGSIAAATPHRTAKTDRAPVLDPVRRLAPIVSWAGERSPTMRSLLDAVEALNGSHLSVSQRVQSDSSMRAHSELTIRKGPGFQVDGRVYLPPAQSRIEAAALLAHEIAHVLAVAGALPRR